MASETIKPPSNPEGKKSKHLNGQGKGTSATLVALVLPDDSLSRLGYHAGDWVEVALGSLWQGDLSAVLLMTGGWLVGFAFRDNTRLLLHSGRPDSQPLSLPLSTIRAGGCVVSLNGRAVIQAGLTLPAEGVDRIRFRFRFQV